LGAGLLRFSPRARVAERRVGFGADRGAGRAIERVVARGCAAGGGVTARGTAVATGAVGARDTGAGVTGAVAEGAEAPGAGSGRGPCEAGAGSGSGPCASVVEGAAASTATTHIHGTHRPGWLYIVRRGSK
jgi:hypothetical protein